MASEVAIAVTYIVGPLYSNLPRRRVDDFASELDKQLIQKIAPFWFPNQPFVGIHQRCLRVNGPYADPLIFTAASKSGISVNEMFLFFPKDELKIWIDPGEVSYQIGDANNEIKYLLKRSYEKLPVVNYSEPYQQNTSSFYAPKLFQPSFTVSSFAKTKFGSTKLKSNNIAANCFDISRPNSLKLNTTKQLPDSNAISGLPYTPDSCSSGMVSPNPNFVNPSDIGSINIPCCLPWSIDGSSNGFPNLLTINIPHYNNTSGRESSGAGSLSSELNSPVNGY